ncbi:MAG: DEAD/DEAH box helicase [Candidatus Aenigmatarchaeota archaeon]
MPDFISHSMLKDETVEVRSYQVSIANKAAGKNTLVVLPTGLGKTQIAILVAANRLESFPGSKVLIVAPTRPLAEQHLNSFTKSMNLVGEQLLLVTGNVEPAKREKLYKWATVICATPQTIENDVLSGRLKLEEISLLVVDEVHRAVKKYAYPIVARQYLKVAEHPRVLGLTASPGSDETRINEICKHLGIEAVEIRNETDKDVEQYVQEQEIEIVKVELEGPLLAAEVELKLALNERMKKLKDWGLHVFSKKDLLVAQQRMQDKLKEGKRPIYYQYLSGIAETIKIWHALELVETQSVAASSAYLEKIADGDSRAAKRMTADPKVDNAIRAIRKLKAEAREHPKTVRLCETIRLELEKNPKLKIIVFSHYRDNIAEIAKRLRLIEGCRPAVLIGQSGETGLSQKEQISIIRDYDCDVYNTLITSPIGEEGLHLASADLAIFYEPVPSEVRTIQRRGRVGRTKVGRIIMLITKGTRDETNFYVAKRKEAKMNEILHGMSRSKDIATDVQENGNGQTGLTGF